MCIPDMHIIVVRVLVCEIVHARSLYLHMGASSCLLCSAQPYPVILCVCLCVHGSLCSARPYPANSCVCVCVFVHAHASQPCPSHSLCYIGAQNAQRCEAWLAKRGALSHWEVTQCNPCTHGATYAHSCAPPPSGLAERVRARWRAWCFGLWTQAWKSRIQAWQRHRHSRAGHRHGRGTGTAEAQAWQRHRHGRAGAEVLGQARMGKPHYLVKQLLPACAHPQPVCIHCPRHACVAAAFPPAHFTRLGILWHTIALPAAEQQVAACHRTTVRLAAPLPPSPAPSQPATLTGKAAPA